MILVFDWGGTSVKHAFWSKQKGLFEQGSFPTPKTWEAMKEKMVSIYNKKEYIKGVAISAPGVVDQSKGMISGISAIPYIHNFPIRDELESLFKLPVSIENDANSAALAELWQGAAADVNNAVFVVIGTGIGGAVIQDRKLLEGRNLFAGEFGIMEFGDEGSFSMLGTAVHMAERYCRQKGLDEKHFTGEEVFVLAEEGDEVAIEEVNKFYHYLSLGIYNLLFTIDPDVIILGGGVSQKSDLVTNLEKHIDARLKSRNLNNYQYSLRACEFHNDANLLGAVYSFLESREEL